MDVEFLGVGASTAALNQKRLPVGQLWKGGIAPVTVGLKNRGYKKCVTCEMIFTVHQLCFHYGCHIPATCTFKSHRTPTPYSDPNFDIQYNQKIDQLQLTNSLTNFLVALHVKFDRIILVLIERKFK